LRRQPARGRARPPGLDRRRVAVVVTLFGWAALPKGIVLLLVPGDRIAAAYKAIGFERFFHVWMAIVLAIGLFVTAMAFAA